MKKFKFFLGVSFFLALLLSACGSQSTATPVPQPRPPSPTQQPTQSLEDLAGTVSSNVATELAQPDIAVFETSGGDYLHVSAEGNFDPQVWMEAGWAVLEGIEINTDVEEIPIDNSFRKIQGTTTWVARSRGLLLIPNHGADNIQVVLNVNGEFQDPIQIKP